MIRIEFRYKEKVPNEGSKDRALMAIGTMDIIERTTSKVFGFPVVKEKIIFSCKINSGGWIAKDFREMKLRENPGIDFKNYPIYAPPGKYQIRSIMGPEEMAKHPNKQAYTLFNFGWFAPLIPLFQTDRSSLGLHPDGGCGTDGIEGWTGSNGCEAAEFRNDKENKECFNIIDLALAKQGSISVEVIDA